MQDIKIQSVSKSYIDLEGQKHQVLSSLSLSIDKGKAALIDGPSGVGKSTLLNIISGLILPDDGSVQIGEVVVNKLNESKRDKFRANNIGYIFQSFNLISPLDILENLVLPMRLNGLSINNLETKARDILVEFGLKNHINKYPYQLSVGQRQRVAAARALLHRPGLLLADEPTASLDQASAKVVVDAMTELKKKGTTLIVATHDPVLKALEFDSVLDLQRKEVA